MASAASAAIVELDTGEILRGEVVERADGKLVLEHAILGTLHLPAERIVEIKPSPDEAGADTEDPPAAQTKPTPADDQPAGPAPPVGQRKEPAGFIGVMSLMDLLKRWNVGFELGASATRGNSETTDLRVGVNARRETEARRIELSARYYGATSEDETTDNEFVALGRHDWLIADSPWFYFARAAYDFDQFEDWRHRITSHGGVGYTWEPMAELTVTPRAGVGFAKEFGDEADELRPEALAGGELTWSPTETQRVEASTFVYPDLEEFGESRITSSIAWSIDLPDLEGLGLKLGLENEYESETEGDEQHNDLRVYATMTLAF